MNKKIAIMVSGGIDSLITYRMAMKERVIDEIIPMYINVGHDYANKELIALRKLIPEAVHINTTLVNAQLDNIPTLERQEIFGRNLLIAFYGALIGDEVWISALETEMNKHAVPDKRPEFFAMATALLTMVMSTKRTTTEVKTTLSKVSKTELITLGLLEKYVTEEELKQSVTCYHPIHHNCGKCSTCFKRWIAMSNNNIKEDYETVPYESEYAISIIQKMRFEVVAQKFSGRFTTKRIEETQTALKKVGIKLY